MGERVEQLTAALVGRYDIEREVGAGGMATVYLARDVRHDRHVALKVLNPELGAVLGVERFLAEIKVTANLQHPNLLPLFDSGEANGLLFYVMPFVEGESLRARLDREKQLPIDEAIRIAVAIANALDYAHGHHVIHRDLKPENILMQAGQPVIADFGIALAVSNAGGNRITQTGLSLGTPQYMSPEQATGDRVIDGRTDIYSLAAMTYEMLTGEAPHTGNTAQAIIARLLTDRPRSVRSSRASVPEYVEAAVAKGLEKLPADRFSTAHEFAEALQGHSALASIAGGTAARTSAVPPASPGLRARLRDPVVLGLSVVAIASAAAAVFALSRRPATEAPMPPVQFIMAATDSTRPIDNYPWPATISSDGSMVVYSVAQGASSSMLYLLRTDQLEPRPIPGTNDGFQPLFSPDGRWIEFEAAGKEKKVRLDGSAPVTISDGGGANGADWTVNDQIVLGAQGTFHGISVVSAAGGEPVAVTQPDTANGEREHIWPIAAPDGKIVVFALWYGTLAGSRLAATSLDDGKVVPLDLRGIRPLVVLDGMLVYVQADGAVMAIRFNARARRTEGKPIPVHDPVPVISALNGNSGIFVSGGGAAVTAEGGARGKLSWLVFDGKSQDVLPDSRAYAYPSISPDERRIAVVVQDEQKSDVWIYDAGMSTFSKLTSQETVTSVQWASDGTHVIYSAAGDQGRGVVWSQLVSGGSAPEKLFEQNELAPLSRMSPDGKWLIVNLYHGTSWDIFRVPVDSPSALSPYLASRAEETGPSFSPDGKWVAVNSDESGRGEVYVRSFPDPSSRIQISVAGGNDPVWSEDGTRLFYRAGPQLLAARISHTPTFTVLSRDTVMSAVNFPASYFSGSYAVSRDGKRILTYTSDKDDFQLVVAPNWITQLRRRMAEAGIGK